MLNRSICIVTLLLLCGQILLAGGMLAPMLGPLHAAWLLQDRLVFWICEAAYRAWPFGHKRCSRRARPKGPKPNPPARRVAAAGCTDGLEQLAEMALDAQTVDQWAAAELTTYYANYRPMLQRREQRAWTELYLQGLLSDIPNNKSIESMLLALQGAAPNAIRNMQHCIGAGTWVGSPLLTRHWSAVDQVLGDPEGVLILDSSEFLKQGHDSVGVKRQHCGEVGKIANCQCGVFLGYASRKGYTLLDRRLYLPQEWVTDAAYAERRQKCGVPEDIEFKTKPQQGAEMLQALHATGRLRAGWLACDEAFGRDTAFLDNVAELGVWYYAEVPHTTRAWKKRPLTAVPAWSGRGRQPTRQRLLKGQPDAQDVVSIAESVSADRWSRQTIKEGTKGPIVADFAVLRVVAVRDRLPGPEVWLVLRRNVETGELKTYLSNAPADTPFETLVQLSGMRWPIETCFEEGKQYLGLGDYQVRTWRGWQHHMTLCILAHFFLLQLKLRLIPIAGPWTWPQVHFLLAAAFLTRQRDTRWRLEVIRYRQQRNQAAYLSHRKRRLALLNHLE